MSDEYEASCPYCGSPETYNIRGTQFECYECGGVFFIDEDGAHCRDSFIMVPADPTKNT